MLSIATHIQNPHHSAAYMQIHIFRPLGCKTARGRAKQAGRQVTQTCAPHNIQGVRMLLRLSMCYSENTRYAALTRQLSWDAPLPQLLRQEPLNKRCNGSRRCEVIVVEEELHHQDCIASHQPQSMDYERSGWSQRNVATSTATH